MGGGGVIRGMTRLMGAATAAMVGQSTMTKASVGFCHAPSTDLPEAKPSSNLPLKNVLEISSSKKPSSDHARCFETEDWEYPVEEDWNGPSNNNNNQLVFVPPPSEEEVEEATKDLCVALHLSIPASSSLVEGSHTPGLMESEEQERELAPYPVPMVVEEEEKVVDASLSSSLPICLGLLTGSSNSVYQAFHLLQTNPKVQDAVKSLARDPAVWKAVLSNEKVMELTQSLQDGDDVDGQKESVPSKDDLGEINIMNITSKVCDFVSARVIQIINKVAEIASSVFSFIETTFYSKEATSAIDKTVASCMMLAVAVLLVVLVKRVMVK